jgi:4-diphosphocytidyl-2-C-methyl-D-erythritol kinase
MAPVTLYSFAKINPVLRVLRKRPDGYHDIETVFQTVDLYDTLTFSPQAGGTLLTCTDPAVPTDERNLVCKAVALIRERYGCSAGIRIDIDKRIPVAAGLAGGSGNAAVTLHALNRLWALGLSEETLRDLAARLGADVPFCLSGGTAVGRGRGERLEWIETGCPAHFVLVNPPLSVSSAWAYQHVKIELTNGMPCINLDVSVWRSGDFGQWIRGLHNDLEAPVRAAFPVVDRVRQALLSGGASGAVMSGSGPTVFGVVPDRTVAERVAGRVRRRADARWRVFAVSPISRREIAARCGLSIP